MGVFADAVRADMDALIRDMQRREEWAIWMGGTSFGNRIVMTGVYMDEFASGASLAQYDPPSQARSAMARMPNLKERIALAVTQAQEKLAAVREAQDIFERNPDLEKLLNIMQKNMF